MISYISGNILETKAQALVNPVNCEGYMGKGLAYQVKTNYPETFKSYVVACRQGDLQIGKIHLFTENNMLIINFPTKNKWRGKSKIDYINVGMPELVETIKTEKLKTIAIPPLGCGLGGLQWEQVKQILLEHLTPIADKIDVYIYQPVEKS